MTEKPLDPDTLARLEEERDFLLRSLDDLDAELAAGDIDEADHAALRDDYTARAAAVLRVLDDQEALREASAAERSRRPLIIGVVGVVLVTGLLGVLLAQSVGSRGSTGLITGTGGSTRELLAECQPLAFSDPEEGITCYEQLLEDDPENVEALTYLGWAHYRADQFDEAGEYFEQVVVLDPTYPDVRVFRAVALKDAEDFAAAQSELDTLYGLDPPPGVLATMRQLGLDQEIAYGLLPADVQACWDRAAEAAQALAAQSQQTQEGATTEGEEAPDPVAAIGDALACFEAVIDERPDDVDALLGKVYVLAITGADEFADDAMASLDRVLVVVPGHPTALLMRAALANVTGDPESALADLDAFDATGGVPSPLYPIAPPDQIRAQAEAAVGATGS